MKHHASIDEVRRACERKARIDSIVAKHGGYAKLEGRALDLVEITSGALKGRQFTTDSKYDAICNDGTIINGDMWFA